MANNPIHIHEIEPELSSSEIDGNELFVVSNPNGPSGYSTSKLTLNSLAEFVNGSGGSYVEDSKIGVISESQESPLTFGIYNNTLCLYKKTTGSVYSFPYTVYFSLGNITNNQIYCSSVDESGEPTKSSLDNCTVMLPTTYNLQQYGGDNTKIIIFANVPDSGLIVPANIFTTFKILCANGSAETIDGSSWIIKNDDSYIKTEFTATSPGTWNFVLRAGTYDYIAIGCGGAVAIWTSGHYGDTPTFIARGDSADVVKGWFTIDEDSVATANVHSGKNVDSAFKTARPGYIEYGNGDAITFNHDGNTYLRINGQNVIDAPYSGGWRIADTTRYEARHATTYEEENKAVTEVIKGKSGGYVSAGQNMSVPDVAYADANYPYGGANGYDTNNYKSVSPHNTANINGYLELRRREETT